MIKIKLFVVNPIHTNCWVLIDEESKDAIIIDLGGEYKKISEYIAEQNANLKFVLCTHGHFDHILGIFEMQIANPEIPVYLNKKDENIALNINSVMEQLGIRGIDKQDKKIKITDFIDENTNNLYIGKNKIQIIETPGHTQGGVCFKINNYLFSGDSLFCREIGRCDLPGSNYEMLIQSLKNKISILPEGTIVYPGHGPSTTIKEENLYNMYLQ
ncbi:MBL fold metallo-hydrolase [bacterium]|nr:MBL fold metallo-hydrolase [bacterium]